jgi:hypothetical protein
MNILWMLEAEAPIARSIPIWPVAPITERFRALTTPKEAMIISVNARLCGLDLLSQSGRYPLQRPGGSV